VPAGVLLAIAAGRFEGGSHRLLFLMMLRRAFALSLTLCAVGAPASAEVRIVRAGDNLQAALNAARPGDELRLAPDATFSGNFVLPVTTGSGVITIRTDLPDASLPGPNQRVTPAAAGRFAKIVSPNTAAALRTAPGAHHWTVKCVEFPANKDGYGDIIQIGDGSAAQSQAAQVPYEIVLDRVYVHGHPLYGQKRGIALNGRTVTIRNSYVADIKSVGFDAQAIAGWNGPGPFSIENNYLEASGEVFLLGGADPAIPNLVSQDVSVRYNHMSRPMSWRDPIVAAPSGGTATAVPGGALPPGSYGYRVVARRSAGQGSMATSTASPEIAATSTGESVTITWSPVANATEYRVYGRSPGGAAQYWTVAAPSFTDTGAAGTPGAPPAEATCWQVKNIFELKNARRVRVEYNLFENNWKAAQPGYAILFTPRGQGGGCPWCVIETVQFSHNIIRNVTAGVNILGYDTGNSTLQTNGIAITENFFSVTTELGGNGWPILIGDEPRDVVIDHNTFDFDGTTALYAYGGTSGAPRRITGFQFTNNAMPHRTYGVNGASASTGTLTLQMYFPGAVFTGNWLSGGTASKYPAGNRFETPFATGLMTQTAVQPRPAGADMARIRPLLESVPGGLMTGVPQPPKGLLIVISSAK
jgi:hypothetical protein